MVIKQILQKTANFWGYQVIEPAKPRPAIEYPFIDVLDLVIRDYLSYESTPFFIQIGANDGVLADPLTRLIKTYEWPGLLVEAQPKAFQQLVKNYQGIDPLIFENVVINRYDGMVPFYAIRDQAEALPFWLYQSGSLDRDQVLGALYYWKNIEKHPNIPENFETLIEEISLPALTIQSLLHKHQIDHVDLLVLDTMGFDFEILKMFPFDTVKPAIIHFEHSLLSREDQDACLKYLAELGYGLTKVAVDTIAYLHAPCRHWKVTYW